MENKIVVHIKTFFEGHDPISRSEGRQLCQMFEGHNDILLDFEGVTEIGDAAFYDCTYLEDMVLPSTIRKIGDNGFALCAKLQKIHVKTATPPTIQAKTFFDVNRQIPVYVPADAVEAYESDPYWGEFDIQAESKAPSEVDNIQSSTTNTQKLLRDGQLLILKDGKTYNAMGQEM